jgi:hypothetical protein
MEGTTDAGPEAADAAIEVSGPVPGPFMLTSPLGKPDDQPTPFLTWSASDNAVTYDLEVSTTETFSDATTQRTTGITQTMSFVPQPLTPAVVHFWRVTAVGPGGARTVASNAPAWVATPFADAQHPYALAVTPKGKLVVLERSTPTGVTILTLGTSSSRMVPAVSVAETRGLAVTADGTRAYISAIGGNWSVSEIDVEVETPARIVENTIGKLIYGLAVTPDGNTLVAPRYVDMVVNDVLDLMAVRPGGVSRSIPLGVFQQPYMITLMPDGASALVNVAGLRRVDLASGMVTTVPMAGGDSIAVTGDGRTAWVTQFTDGVREADLTTSTPGRAIPFNATTDQCGLAVSPDGTHAVVSGYTQLGVLDLVAGKVETTYPLHAFCATISPDSKRAYVSTIGPASHGLVVVLKLP